MPNLDWLRSRVVGHFQPLEISVECVHLRNGHLCSIGLSIEMVSIEIDETLEDPGHEPMVVVGSLASPDD